MSYLSELFDVSRYSPHGISFQWQPDILLLHVGSDALTAIAYFSIPAALLTFIRKRPDIKNGIVMKMFIAFILLSGVSHVSSIVVVWIPAFAIEGLIKLTTAIVSVATAVILWSLIPRALVMPSRTQMEQRNAEIEELNRRLQHRIDSLSTLAGGVAHEFNNLLTVVQGHSEFLAENDSNREESIRAISSSADRMIYTCRQMLAYSGRGHFVLDSINVNEIVTSVEQRNRALVQIKLDLAELPDIEAENTQISELMDNLVQNSIESMEEASVSDGEILIRTSVEKFSEDDLGEAEFEHEMLPGEAVVIEITDNGTGMTEEIRERAFEPYFTTRFVGRGLGLAAAQGIIRGHKGALFLDSTVGQGTTIQLAFPIRAPETTRYAEPMANPTRLIMMVDDERDVLDLATQYLEACNIKVIGCIDADEAFELFKRHHGDLDAVIVDYLMPGMTGVELIKKFRQVATIDTYLTSGYGRGEIADPALRSILTGFIAKPFSLEDFRRMFKDN